VCGESRTHGSERGKARIGLPISTTSRCNHVNDSIATEICPMPLTKEK